MRPNDRELCRTSAGPSKMRRPMSAFRRLPFINAADSLTEPPTFCFRPPSTPSLSATLARRR
jgi:hypothetical protein